MDFTECVVPYPISDENPDESEFVAVITLSSNKHRHTQYVDEQRIKSYEFKIRADSFVYFEPLYNYFKQPSGK